MFIIEIWVISFFILTILSVIVSPCLHLHLLFLFLSGMIILFPNCPFFGFLFLCTSLSFFTLLFFYFFLFSSLFFMNWLYGDGINIQSDQKLVTFFKWNSKTNFRYLYTYLFKNLCGILCHYTLQPLRQLHDCDITELGLDDELLWMFF